MIPAIAPKVSTHTSRRLDPRPSTKTWMVSSVQAARTLPSKGYAARAAPQTGKFREMRPFPDQQVQRFRPRFSKTQKRIDPGHNPAA